MKFNRPVGAAADVKELEYVCALHQTQDDENWMDGSIEPIDVVYFLRSRYGIFTNVDEVKKLIFKGLAGGDGEDDCLDMMEMVAVLIIPLLLKVSRIAPVAQRKREDFSSGRAFKEYTMLQEKKKSLEPPSRIIGDLLRNILTDSEFYDNASGKHIHPKITPAVVRKIFGVYDELELIADDDLVNEMVAMASGGDPNAVLDEKALTKALTDDVKLYDPNNESKLTTDFYDVFGTDSRSNKFREAADEKAEHDVDVNQVDTKMTIGQIDFTADNIRSTIHTCLMWIILIASYLIYIYQYGQKLEACTMENPDFGCKVANSICNWLQDMAILVILGTTIGTSLSFGNTIMSNSILGPIIGIAADVVFVFFPLIFEIDGYFFKTKQVPEWDIFAQVFKWIVILSGIFLGLLQIQNLIGLLVPAEAIAKNGILSNLVLGNTMKAAFRMKQAASFKVNNLVRNAYSLHEHNDEANERRDIKKNLLNENATKSTQEIALLNYTKVVEDTEEFGGLLWSWKEYLTGGIQSEEGVWLHSRLIASNAVQFSLCFVMFVTFVSFANYLDDARDAIAYSFSEEASTRYDANCQPTFDTNNCYFPFGPRVYTGAAACIMDDLPSACTTSGGLLRAIEGNTIANRDICVQANGMFAGYAYSWSYNEIENPCHDILNGIKDFIDVEYNASDEIRNEYIDCKVYPICRDLYPLESVIGGYDECLRFNSSNCTSLEKTVDAMAFEIGETKHGYNSSRVTECMVGAAYDSYFALMNDFCSGFSVFRPEAPVATWLTNSSCQTVIKYCLYGEVFKTEKYPGINASVCLLGIHPDTLLPFQWRGDDCADNIHIKPMMDYYTEIIEPKVTLVEDMVPHEWVIRVTFGVATAVSIITALAVCLVYIPSAIHTILKFRSGVIPSLKDPYFIKYRKSLHLTTFMIGAMFWGLLFTTLLVALLLAGGLFLVLWHVTQPFFYGLIAAVIGISVTLVLKILVCFFVGKATFAGL